MLSSPKTPQFSTLNSQSSMLDFLWGVQDSLGGAKSRDYSRRLHSPLPSLPHEDVTCLV